MNAGEQTSPGRRLTTLLSEAEEAKRELEHFLEASQKALAALDKDSWGVSASDFARMRLPEYADLRDATSSELDEARSIARRLIEVFAATL